MPVNCGTIKEYFENTKGVKQIYVLLNSRGKGIAPIILKELEFLSIELNNSKCTLETGKKQPEAIKLYKKSNTKLWAI